MELDRTLPAFLLALGAIGSMNVLADEPPGQGRQQLEIRTYQHAEAGTNALRRFRLLEAEIPQKPSYAQHNDMRDVLTALAASDVKTLVVFDIDDTLLTVPEFFGSDSWYEWQKTVAAKSDGTRPQGYVPCTFDVIAINQEAARQKTTQPDAAAIFNSIVTDKIIVTSRNPATRGATERELTQRDAGEVAVVLPSHLVPGVDIGWIYTSRADPKRVVDVSYHHGIFMVNGTNKGLALLDLLRRFEGAYGFKADYRRIILVDDGEKNIVNMDAALQNSGIEFVPIWYTRVGKMKPTPERIQSSEASWNALAEYWGKDFPARYNLIKTQQQCHYGGLIQGAFKE